MGFEGHNLMDLMELGVVTSPRSCPRRYLQDLIVTFLIYIF
jgi:hypothetical protein